MRRKPNAKKVKSNVGALVERLPNLTKDDRFLLIAYWQVYDGIEIPPKVAKEIITRGTKPESITRSKRKVRK